MKPFSSGTAFFTLFVCFSAIIGVCTATDAFPNQIKSKRIFTWDISCETEGTTCADGLLVGYEVPGQLVTGKLPEISSDLPLKVLDLSDTLTFGTISESFTRLSDLEVLRLHGSFIFDPDFHLCKMSNLKEVSINGAESLDDHCPKTIQSSVNTAFVTLHPDDVQFICDVLASSNAASVLEGWTDCQSAINACDWQGVFCSNGRISTFSIYLTSFSGNLPESISDLAGLLYLDLEGDISGTIPSTIGALTGVNEIFFSDNNLSGTVPSEIGLLSSVTFLAFNENFLVGSLPDTLSNLLPVLGEIFVGGNRLACDIPPSIEHIVNDIGDFNCTVESFFCDMLEDTDISKVTSNGWDECLSELDVCKRNWDGVTCDEDLEVVKELDFGGLEITGSLPASVGNLVEMEYLNLYSNSLSGAFPIEVSNLVSLVGLDLEGNMFDGQFPMVMDLPLEDLSLENNQFSGTVEDSISNLSLLTSLELEDNYFTGYLPSSISTMSNLIEINVEENDFVGTLPTEWSLLTNLVEINVAKNELSGTVPLEFATLPGLEVLKVFDNMVSDEGRDDICDNSPSLITFYLRAGYNDCTLDTYFPTSNPTPSPTDVPDLNLALCDIMSYSDITSKTNWGLCEDAFNACDNWDGVYCNSNGDLTKLRLGDLGISGAVPSALFDIDTLEHISFHGNAFTGNFDGISSFTSLTLLDLANNHFSGNLPSMLNSVSSLKYCNIRDNHFDGVVSSGDVNHPAISFLDMGGNSISGSLPSTLDSATLKKIKIDGNNFTGSLPTSYNVPSLQQLRAGNNGFMYAIPAAIGNATALTILDLKKNDLTGNLPFEMTNLVNLRVLEVQENSLNIFPNELCDGSMSSLTKFYFSDSGHECDIPSGP